MVFLRSAESPEVLWFAEHMPLPTFDLIEGRGTRRAIYFGLSTIVIAGMIVGAPSVNASRKNLDAAAVKVTAGSADQVTGSMRVRLSMRDGGRLRFAIPSHTSKGNVTSRASSVASTTSGFTYTPTAVARHAAARLTAGASDKGDTFAVTVKDGHGGSAAIPIRLRVSPKNAAPIMSPVVAPPEATGVVKGNVGASDPDADPIIFSVTTQPAHGSVVVAGDGSFTYTPTTSTARRGYATQGTTDTFTITATDGFGGSATAGVSADGSFTYTPT